MIRQFWRAILAQGEEGRASRAATGPAGAVC
jgi:hypothetical protein